MLDVIATAGAAGISLSTLTTQVGLRASTGRTLLSALVIHGMVAQIPATRRYVLGSKFFELNRTYVLQLDLGSVAGPVVRRLWEITGETVHLATLQHERRVDLAVLVSPQLLNINPTAVGSPGAPVEPLVHTAAGKVLLAGLDTADRQRILDRAPESVDLSHTRDELARVQRDGVATNHEEEASGVCGVAAPVKDHTSRVVAALCIGYPSVRRTDEHEASLRVAVVAAAAELSALLGAATAPVAEPAGVSDE